MRKQTIEERVEVFKKWLESDKKPPVYFWDFINSTWEMVLTPFVLWDNEKEIFIIKDGYFELRKAWYEEKEIQAACQYGAWKTLDICPNWNLPPSYYRVKPEEWYENIPEKGILCEVWDSEDGKKHWALIKEYKKQNGNYGFTSSTGFAWKHARPLTFDEITEYIWKGSK